MSSSLRVQTGRYTEADILSLYIKYRETEIGPFTREVGDFIAHSKRDRGATLDVTAYMFSQLQFFKTYQMDPTRALEPKGNCGWWLRHYLLTKIKQRNNEQIQKELNLTRKEAKNMVKSWFQRDSIYPTTINCNQPQFLYRMAQLFSKTILGMSVFEIAQVKAEIEEIFEIEGIEQSEFERFLVGTAVLLKGKCIEIVPGFTATIKLSVDKNRCTSIHENGKETGFIRLSPDGNLNINVLTGSRTNDDAVKVSVPFLETGIDTEMYFARSLVNFDQNQFPNLQIDQPLIFDTSNSPPAFLVHEMNQ